MEFVDRLEELRERNKDLLNRLKRLGADVERLNGCSQREREDEAEARRDPAEIVTLTDGDRGPARIALSKAIVRFADTCEEQTDASEMIPTAGMTSKHGGQSAECATPAETVKDSNRHHNRSQDTRLGGTNSCLTRRTTYLSLQKETGGQVSFQFDESDEISASDRHHLQPLLGYDWIAGVLDAEDSLTERSDEFFNDLRTFRSLNKDECVHKAPAELSENQSDLPLMTDRKGPEANVDTHQCTFSYRINSRLFPVPLHSQECCPVCKTHKNSHPHTATDPALIRFINAFSAHCPHQKSYERSGRQKMVSIPRFTLLPPYKYKAHRRCSFDPSDSLGLPSHCLSGWSNKGQSTLPPPSNLDLRSSLNMKNRETQSQEVEAPPVLKVSRKQISDVSRLARHHFQHFSPKRKLERTFYSSP